MLIILKDKKTDCLNVVPGSATKTALMTKEKHKSNQFRLTIRITEQEKRMVAFIKDAEGFRNESEVIRFLLRNRYLTKYDHVGEENCLD